MRDRKKLKSYRDGAKSPLEKYGKRLISRRHQYYIELRLFHKTVELIAESTPWIPQTQEIPSDTIVGMNVGLQEVELQTAISQAGENASARLSFWS